MSAKPDTEALSAYLPEWETIAYLKNIEAVAEQLSKATRELLAKQEQGNALPIDAEGFSLSRKDLSDYLLSAEQGIYEISLAASKITSFATEDADFSRLYWGSKGDLSHLIKLTQKRDLIVLKTPYLTKSLFSNKAANVPFDPLRTPLYSIDSSMFKPGPIDMYILSVYKTGTPPALIADADNINVKAFGDPIVQLLEKDDNGIEMGLFIYSIYDDDLDEGTYTIVVPNKQKKLTAKQLKYTVKMAF